MKLSYDDVKRYIAHINLKKIGSFGQKKIIDTKVLIIGVGGLGSPVALYLASSGINNIGIVDHDKIDISNLHRQILFNEEDVNKFKVDIAEKRLEKINSKIKIKKFKTRTYIDFVLRFNISINEFSGISHSAFSLYL